MNQTGIIMDLTSRIEQRCVQGIKGGRNYSNESLFGGYFNGAGAFMFYPERFLDLKWENSYNGKIQSYDIRPEFKARSDRRITKNVINAFLAANKGKVIPLLWDNSERLLKPDVSELDWGFLD